MTSKTIDGKNVLQYIALMNPMTYATAFFRTLSLEKMTLSEDELIAEQLAFKVSHLVITPQTY